MVIVVVRLVEDVSLLRDPTWLVYWFLSRFVLCSSIIQHEFFGLINARNATRTVLAWAG